MTGTAVLFFGTLDASEMGAVAVWTWRTYFIALGVLFFFLYALAGNWARAGFALVYDTMDYAKKFEPKYRLVRQVKIV